MVGGGGINHSGEGPVRVRLRSRRQESSSPQTSNQTLRTHVYLFHQRGVDARHELAAHLLDKLLGSDWLGIVRPSTQAASSTTPPGRPRLDVPVVNFDTRPGAPVHYRQCA